MIEGLSIAAGTGRVTVAGRAGRDIDLTVGIRALPLALARIAAPGPGAVRHPRRRGGSAGLPTVRRGTTRSRSPSLVTPETRQAGLPPIEARAKGDLATGGPASTGASRPGAASR